MSNAGQLVVACLGEASSQNPAVIKQAEERLKQWETEPGFYSILLTIFTDLSLDVHIRWQAVLYFKNGVDRYWRQNAPNAISMEEKVGLRSGLVKTISEVRFHSFFGSKESMKRTLGLGRLHRLCISPWLKK